MKINFKSAQNSAATCLNLYNMSLLSKVKEKIKCFIKRNKIHQTFEGKVAIVTGGASGIGLALCQALSKEGAYVIVADIDLTKALSVAAQLNKGKEHAFAFSMDITKPDSVKSVIEEVKKRFGILDYYFNVAGIAVFGEIRDLTTEQWRAIIEVNLFGTLYGMRFAYDVFLKQGHGHIVNVASGFGLIPSVINTPYAITKAAIVRASESLRAEAADFNIQVSVVCPGLVSTPFLEKTSVANADPKEMASQVKFKPITPEECVSYILTGIRRNKFMMAFPFYVKLGYLEYRLVPSLMFRRNLKRIREFRLIRKTEK